MLIAKVPLLAAIIFCAQLSAQSFEVATIKPTPLDWGKGRFIRMQSAHQLEAKNFALKILLAAAYNLNPHAISGGPAWVESDRYDILAKTPGEVRPSHEEQMSMLRKLLDERFQLKFHREPKEMPLYTLTAMKNGTKLRESAPNLPPEGPPLLAFVIDPERVALPARSATMAEFAAVLQRAALDRPVVDNTGLNGRYDFDLEFTPDESLFGGALGNPPADAAKPGLFAAIQQQLGLKFEATRGIISTLVIDRVERPTEN